MEPTIVAAGASGVAHPVYSSSKASFFTSAEEEMANTLVATDYKDPPIVNEPRYIVRRLTPTECARLQGFPDWWCDELGTENPTNKSIKLAVIGSGIFSVWMMGMILPLFFGYRTGYLESIRAGYGDAYVETISSITPDWMFFVLFALCILGGILGGLLGAKVLKKHFKKMIYQRKNK